MTHISNNCGLLLCFMFWLKLNFQDNLNFFSEYLTFFHDCNLLVMLSLLSFISFFILSLFFNIFFKSFFKELELIEIVWTFLPCLILLFLGWPSMQLLYSLENSNMENNLTLKVIGHQWYWSYNYTNFNELEFDSFMILENELAEGGFRLLDVDNKVILPFNNSIRIVVISADVLHSWALPALGIKLDANPGRMNQTFIFSSTPGEFFGQCSELCGVNHSFMPINVEFTSMLMFKNWSSTFNFIN